VPGNVLHLNHDDDNNNQVEDREEGPGPLGFNDDDLELAVLKVDEMAASAWVGGAAGGSEGWLDGVSLQISHSENLALWRSQDKEPLDLTYAFTAEGAPSNVPDEIYVEGIELGEGTVTWELIAPTEEYPGGEVVASDVVKFTVIDVNLRIYHGPKGDGSPGDPVPDGDEETIGAFTVANLNDTDGDGVRDDVDDNGIPPDPAKGRPEIDLIRLDIELLGPDPGGAVNIETSQGMVRLWQEREKQNEIPLDMYGNTFFNTSELPKEVWVEIVTPSSQLRDVVITAYCGKEPRAADTVNATGVWATLTAAEHDTKSAAQLFAPGTPWEHMSDPPRPIAVMQGGTGLRPIPLQSPTMDWAGNAIWLRYTVTPPGIQYAGAPEFDLTSRAEANVWRLNGSWEIARETEKTRYPEPNEEPNDDAKDDDESPWPDVNRHMFYVDAPGVENTVAPGVTYAVGYFNFEAYARVSFDGMDPAGNQVRGTRASPKVQWHTYHTLRDDGTGHWERTSGDDPEIAGQNEVGLGPIDDIGDPDQPPPRPW
jgi:hypothetical protein